jgi:hypothetical protein
MKTYKLFALCAAALLPAWTVFAQEETLENTPHGKPKFLHRQLVEQILLSGLPATDTDLFRWMQATAMD